MEASALKQASRRGLLPRRSRLLRLQGDERLVAMVREGNAGAFEAIVDRYQGRLLGFCRQMLRSTEDAEDILQEVFVNAYKAMMADNREINLRPWLYRIARNRCLNHLRKPTADSRESMDMVPITEAASTAETVHNREEFRQLLTDVSKLPETQRTALLLREMDGLSYDEISESMDTTVPSVKSLLVRARMSLSEASQARMLTCGEVRLSLAEAAEGLSKVSGPVRRHVRDCDECADFRKQLRSNSKAFSMIFPAGPLMAMKALLLTKLGGGAAAGSGGVCSAAAGSAAGGAAAGGGAATGAAVGGGAAVAGGSAAAAGAAAVGGSAAASAGLATAAIGGGSAMSSAIGAKALAGVVTAAVITAGAVEVKSGGPAQHDPATLSSAPAAKIAPPTHSPAPVPLAITPEKEKPVIAVSTAVPAKSVTEQEATEAEAAAVEPVPADPVPAEPVPPVASETEEAAEDPAAKETTKHPAGKSDSHARPSVPTGGKGSPKVPIDPDSIVIVAPTKGAEGPTGPSGPSGPTGPDTPPVIHPSEPPPIERSPTPPPTQTTPTPPAEEAETEPSAPDGPAPGGPAPESQD